MNKVLPTLGGLISKNKEAYTYLPNSIDEFLTTENLCNFKTNFPQLIIFLSTLKEPIPRTTAQLRIPRRFFLPRNIIAFVKSTVMKKIISKGGSSSK